MQWSTAKPTKHYGGTSSSAKWVLWVISEPHLAAGGILCKVLRGCVREFAVLLHASIPMGRQFLPTGVPSALAHFLPAQTTTTDVTLNALAWCPRE